MILAILDIRDEYMIQISQIREVSYLYEESQMNDFGQQINHALEKERTRHIVCHSIVVSGVRNL